MHLNKLEQHEQSEENRPILKLLEKIAVYIGPKKLGNLLLMGAMLSTPTYIQAKSIEVENAETTTPSVSVVVPDLRPLFEGTATPNAPQATLTSMPKEILQTPQAPPSPAEMAVQDMPDEEMAALPIEEQKKIIEASYDGGIVHEAIVMDEETLIFYDGKEWQELPALWGFNDEPVPWGEVYSLEDAEDIDALKNIVGGDEKRINFLNTEIEKYSEIKYLQFYPNKDSWTAQNDPNKPMYGTYELGGYLVLKENNKIFVVEATTSPYRILIVIQGQSGQYPVAPMFSEDGSGLQPLLIGVSPEREFTSSSTGSSLYNPKDLSEKDVENWIGAEDIDPNNIKSFIQLLEEENFPFFHFVIQTGTIADKE